MLVCYSNAVSHLTSSEGSNTELVFHVFSLIEVLVYVALLEAAESSILAFSEKGGFLSGGSFAAHINR